MSASTTATTIRVIITIIPTTRTITIPRLPQKSRMKAIPEAIPTLTPTSSLWGWIHLSRLPRTALSWPTGLVPTILRLSQNSSRTGRVSL